MFLKPYYQNIMFNSCVFDDKHFSLKKTLRRITRSVGRKLMIGHSLINYKGEVFNKLWW